MTIEAISTARLPPSPLPSSAALFTRIRSATAADVPQLHRMIHQMAIFEDLMYMFSATQESLSATLFPPPPAAPPPFYSPFTVLIVEVSTKPFPVPPQQKIPHFTPILNTIIHHFQEEEDGIYDDADKEFFKGGEDSTIAGYVLFFPIYATLMGRPGLHVDNIFVRKCFRRKGLGKLMLSAVARQASKMGYGRVEWKVLDWNNEALKFYQDMGAEIMHQWKICRFSGKTLQEFGRDETEQYTIKTYSV